MKIFIPVSNIFAYFCLNNMDRKETEKILGKARIAIAGAGGLGSNCAVSLARAGVGFIRIVDYDRVSRENLNRQYYFLDQCGKSKVKALKENILKINPEIHIEAIDQKIDASNINSLFDGVDIVVEALDAAAEKQMLIEGVLQTFPDKPLVCGIGLAGRGNFEALKIERHGSLFICGDLQTEVGENLFPMAPRVAIVANMQANLVIDILLETIKND